MQERELLIIYLKTLRKNSQIKQTNQVTCCGTKKEEYLNRLLSNILARGTEYVLGYIIVSNALYFVSDKYSQSVSIKYTAFPLNS